jgi:hypothetical protein
LKRVHQEGLGQTAVEVRRMKPARQRVLKTKTGSVVSRELPMVRGHAQSYIRKPSKGKTIKLPFTMLRQGPRCVKSKILKFSTQHRGMPNTGPRGKTTITRALVMWLQPRTLEDGFNYPPLDGFLSWCDEGVWTNVNLGRALVAS